MEKSPIRENVSNNRSRYEFVNIRPGGNDTCLIKARPSSLEERQRVNNEIMRLYSNIEQVGFIYTDQDENLNLTMAGGEFCGNATRSAAYLALDGKTGDLKIRVSGVTDKLKAGVRNNGEAYAQMPINRDKSKIKPDLQKPQTWIVEMEGISQVVIFCDKNKAFQPPEELKEEAMDILEKRGLKQIPAAGVIYASQNENGWQIDPVVYVRDINTCFYETACGSGTTALGQVLALQKEGSIERVPVQQPSGQVINISINYDGQEFQYAEISGKIQSIAVGILAKSEKSGGVIIETILDEDSLEKALAGGLIETYQKVFAGPPYFENFTREEVRRYFRDYFKNGLILIARDEKGILGFAAAVDVLSETTIAKLAVEKGIDIERCAYIAELGVDENNRRKGVGISLVEELLMALPDERTLLRTNKDNYPAISLYQRLGFSIVPEMTELVKQRRVDGEEFIDERIFMIKDL